MPFGPLRKALPPGAIGGTATFEAPTSAASFPAPRAPVAKQALIDLLRRLGEDKHSTPRSWRSRGLAQNRGSSRSRTRPKLRRLEENSRAADLTHSDRRDITQPPRDHRTRVEAERRRTVVGMDIEGSTGWVVAEHGRHAGYVRNIEMNPDVRVRLRRGWRPARARLVPDDDPQARLRAFNRPTHAASVRRFGTDLVSVRFDFTSG